ncbi:serine/threonine protein kinase [Saccharibacillus sp. JS10]|uniref:protein kinase domain-containing protein n=1 Tax=Saccharibacillus sp. JS10 TaxID=2950552 RepID=UPI00210A1D78|nr:serine/threonine protein kinase [Saccharibacillus sp. JS10]
MQQRVDGISFWLRRPHDFNWLAPFGIVFKIWDQQDSGNIAFGLKIEDQQVFIKYAGASTVRYEGYPFDAVRRLRDAARSFEALQHPNLVRLLDHFDTEEGYALIFEWTDGELLLRNDDPDSGISKFRRLPIQERLDAMQQILDFHVHVEASGYVAIDLYDGSLIYDFERKTMTICDIDFYCPAPYTNEMGRMWGSSRFMSPEEYELGAEIDSRTNVYALGAMAFCLLGNESDRSRECWEASDELYEIAAKAVSAERTERWESVEQFCEVWEAARFKD